MKQFKLTPYAGIALLSAMALLVGCSPAEVDEPVQVAEVADAVETPETEYRTLTLAEYEDKVAGGWIGQATGVLFGAPTEFLWPGEMIPFDFDGWYRRKPGLVDEALALEYLLARDYEKMLALRMERKNDFSTWETYTPLQMPSQDDLYIEFLFLHSIRTHGLDVSAEQMAQDWLSYLEPNMIWGANQSAYESFQQGIMPPLSGQHPNSPGLGNAIDFQIESDMFGLISPGLPQASNSLGDRAGHLMNYGDGVYGGLAMAAMYGEAFFESDPRKLVEHSMKAIPAESRYHEMIQDVITAHDANPDNWEAAWEVIFDKWGEYLGLDVRTNGACVYLGLLYGDGDFLKTMNVSMRCGLDSDCNPSSSAGILATSMGMSGIPEEWTTLRDLTISNTASSGGLTLKEIYPDPMQWDDIIAATVEVGHKNILANGGKIEDGIIYIPRKMPVAPPLEQVTMPGGAE